MPKQLRVAVLAGGNTAERKISQISGTAVMEACRSLGHAVTMYDPAADIAKLAKDTKKIDVVLPILHGKRGEDGAIQGLLELLQLPYVGSDVLGSALAYRKVVAKEIYKQHKLPVARDFLALKSDPDAEKKAWKKVGAPCFVKPANEGSSFGASIVRKKSELLPALKAAWKYDNEVLVEEYLKGTEITVGILETAGRLRALPIIEIRSKHAFFDLKSKYDPKLCEEICPAPIDPKLAAQAKKFAKKAHKALRLRDLSRTDMIIVGKKLYLLETNTMPGFTPASLYPQMVVTAGMTFPELCQQLIDNALQR